MTLQPCQYCATDDTIYLGYCRGCNVRRIARLVSDASTDACINAEASINGHAAAQALRRDVLTERARLKSEGKW